MKRSLDAFRFDAQDLTGLARGLAGQQRNVARRTRQTSPKTLAHRSADKSEGGRESRSGSTSQPTKRETSLSARKYSTTAESYPSKLSSIETPFVAPAPAKYRERFATTCSACFRASKPCGHHAEAPLRLLLIGHNPSDHAWASGYFYSNPTNRMWKLLTGQLLDKDGAGAFDGVFPADTPIEAQNNLPSEFGVGLTDMGLEPGNDANAYGKSVMLGWAQGLFRRLAAHKERAGGAPALVAFTGVRQFRMMFPNNIGAIEPGEQTRPMPVGWPFEPAETRVWVLPSSSGRAVMTHERRRAPYAALAQAVARVPAQTHVAELSKAS
mmetsp:Transcript_19866/g.63752  ORF Transcript_19866/g.63752 Transcript_19866/m.63752 type:complete len:325 (-) Transcript_19866:375-1349(-)